MFVFSGFPSYMMTCFAGWIEREQAEAIEYLQAENRILRGRPGSGESPRGGHHVLGRAFNAQDLLYLCGGLAPGPQVMTRGW